MELIKETVNVNESVYKGNTQTMVDGDVIVPDVKPDILKILQVDAVSCVTDKQISNGRAVISGRVDLKILYIPDKESEKINSIITSFDFMQPIDCRGVTDEMTVLASASAERADFSMTNSRKLKIRATVAIDYEIVSPKALEIAVGVLDNETAELKKERFTLQNMVDLSEHEIVIHESIEVPNGQVSIGELLKTDIKISDTEYKTVTGKIVVKGALGVCMLYTGDTGNIEFTEEEIPFTEVLDSDEVSESTQCDIDYAITDVVCKVIEDGDGDSRIVDLEVTLCAQVCATDAVEMEMISDCYEPYKKTELTCSQVNMTEIAAKPSMQNTIREMIDVGANAPAVSGVYNVITKPYVTKAELQRDKLICEGRIDAYILYLSDSSDNPVYSVKKELPFSYMLDCDTDANNLLPEVKAEIKHTGYNLNAAGEIELRCILSINANIVLKRSINIIAEANTYERTDEDKKGIVIYFVQEGDSLWSIAKNYGVPISSIVSFNGLNEEDILPVGARLFIPN